MSHFWPALLDQTENSEGNCYVFSGVKSFRGLKTKFWKDKPLQFTHLAIVLNP